MDQKIKNLIKTLEFIKVERVVMWKGQRIQTYREITSGTEEIYNDMKQWANGYISTCEVSGPDT